MGENLLEAPKSGLWVENLYGGSPPTLKKKENKLEKKQKEKEKDDTCALVFFLLVVDQIRFLDPQQNFFLTSPSPLLAHSMDHSNMHPFIHFTS